MFFLLLFFLPQWRIHFYPVLIRKIRAGRSRDVSLKYEGLPPTSKHKYKGEGRKQRVVWQPSSMWRFVLIAANYLRASRFLSRASAEEKWDERGKRINVWAMLAAGNCRQDGPDWWRMVEHTTGDADCQGPACRRLAGDLQETVAASRGGGYHFQIKEFCQKMAGSGVRVVSCRKEVWSASARNWILLPYDWILMTSAFLYCRSSLRNHHVYILFQQA